MNSALFSEHFGAIVTIEFYPAEDDAYPEGFYSALTSQGTEILTGKKANGEASTTLAAHDHRTGKVTGPKVEAYRSLYNGSEDGTLDAEFLYTVVAAAWQVALTDDIKEASTYMAL
jgi:hypothetical protein